MSALRKRDVAQATGVAKAPGACAFSKSYPCLWEFLTATAYPSEGGLRVPGTLTFFAEPGSFKACLNDRDQGITAFASGASFTACLVALEAGLKEDDLEWKQPSTAFKKKKGS
jgi:hypothetical protein